MSTPKLLGSGKDEEALFLSALGFSSLASARSSKCFMNLKKQGMRRSQKHSLHKLKNNRRLPSGNTQKHTQVFLSLRVIGRTSDS